jgi:hypothetical protein
MKTDIPETVHTSYIPWLARVDALIGKPARLDLARHTSFIAAWQEGLSPHEAVADAKIRSNAQRLPRWRMRWKQAIWDVSGCRPGWAAIAGGRADHRRRGPAHRRQVAKLPELLRLWLWPSMEAPPYCSVRRSPRRSRAAGSGAPPPLAELEFLACHGPQPCSIQDAALRELRPSAWRGRLCRSDPTLRTRSQTRPT